MMRVDTTELKLAGKTLKAITKEVPRAFYSALNRTAQRVKTEAHREVRKRYYIKQKDVAAIVSVSKSGKYQAYAEVRAKGRNIPLSKFNVRPTASRIPYPPPKVLKARVKKGGGLKAVPGAFITRVGRGGHMGVFERLSKRRLPIRELYGPGVPQMLGNREIIDHLERTAETEMEKRLAHELKRRLPKGD
ncbi:phage tail protein [Paenibacillus sp. P22]|uniref:phage tail protein n=1 Tax=Paenibacillus sp. P22 TaxID=483908 RepID=UPI0004361F3A|nr:phage tail protein [Paenibacillus sp. P22]CDN41455.1 Uncharacterized protein BN871_AH_00290 [Paenibacillus sp. P22]